MLSDADRVDHGTNITAKSIAAAAVIASVLVQDKHWPTVHRVRKRSNDDCVRIRLSNRLDTLGVSWLPSALHPSWVAINYLWFFRNWFTVFLNGLLRLLLLNRFRKMALANSWLLHLSLVPYSAARCHIGDPNANAGRREPGAKP